jgi:ankyrin repeat protein
LYFTRLPLPSVTENAVAIARALLHRGANPNVYLTVGDSRYTPLTGAIGEGEEGWPAHQQRDALVRLLPERGADPYNKVTDNIHFNGKVLCSHASRPASSGQQLHDRVEHAATGDRIVALSHQRLAESEKPQLAQITRTTRHGHAKACADWFHPSRSVKQA